MPDQNYTPPWQEVRAAYTQVRISQSGYTPVQIRGYWAEFDRFQAVVVDGLIGELHDWAALHGGPEGANFARIWESKLRSRAADIREGKR